MREKPRTSARERWTPLLRRVALVAVLAVVSSALLPLAHGSASHVGDCGVCSALVHGGANVADSAPPVVSPTLAVGPEIELVELELTPPRRDFALRLARAPPSDSVTA